LCFYCALYDNDFGKSPFVKVIGMQLKVKWVFFDLGSTLIDETAADNRRIRDDMLPL